MSKNDNIIRVQVQEINKEDAKLNFKKIGKAKSSIVIKQNFQKEVKLATPGLRAGVEKRKINSVSDDTLEINTISKKEGK